MSRGETGEMSAARDRPAAWPDRIGGAAVLLLSLAYFGALAPYGLNVDDEGTLLYQIYRLFSGERLYTDFHAGYTPGIFYWNAALFWLCGVNVVAVRLVLALVNAATVYCLFWLARRLGAGRLAAAAAGVAYVAFIPFYDGDFAAFNIPYPIWYVTLFWLLSVVCAVRWWETGKGSLWLLAGLAAGVVFSFKPNSGLLDLAVLVSAAVVLQMPQASGAGGVRGLLERAARVCRGLGPAALTVALALLFARGAGDGWRELLIFAVPMATVLAYAVVALRGMARPAPALRVWRDLLLLGAGFAAVIVPWSAVFLARMGVAPFMRAILFIGTNFDRFYYMPYPSLGLWDWAIGAAIVALGLLAAALNRRLLPPWVVGSATLLGGASVALLLWRHPPPMVEGFQVSVVTRVRAQAFGVVLILEWVAILAFFRHGSRGGARAAPSEGDHDRRTGALFIAILSAVLMHMQLYPRTDFMHLVPASPGVLVLGAWLLHRFATACSRGLAQARRARAAVVLLAVAPAFVLCAILLGPAVSRIAYLARAAWRGDDGAVVRLASPRAPLVVEPSTANALRDLGDAARYLRAHVTPDDAVFTFPALDLVLFLADRQNPTRHGYFFPGWPGHEVEAEVIDALRARPPRYVVTLHAHALYFIAAPVYYFNLRQFVTTHYVLERRFGTIDVLRPVDRPAASAPAADETDEAAIPLADWRAELQRAGTSVAARLEGVLATMKAGTAVDLAAALRQSDPEVQRAAARLVRKSRNPAGAAAFATLWVEGRLTPVMQALAQRVVAEDADVQAVPALLGGVLHGDAVLREATAGDLFFIAARSWIEEYWYKPPVHREFAEIERLVPAADLTRWIDNPGELLPLRLFAIRAAANRSDRAALAALLHLASNEQETTYLRTDATQSLVALGLGPEVVKILGVLLRQTDLVPAVLITRVYPRAPEQTRAVIAEAMRSDDPGLRATGLWIAAAVGDRRLIGDVLARVGDSAPDVRIAAAWTLGELRAQEGVAALQQLRHDANDIVVQYAERALARLAAAPADKGRT